MLCQLPMLHEEDKALVVPNMFNCVFEFRGADRKYYSALLNECQEPSGFALHEATGTFRIEHLYGCTSSTLILLFLDISITSIILSVGKCNLVLCRLMTSAVTVTLCSL